MRGNESTGFRTSNFPERTGIKWVKTARFGNFVVQTWIFFSTNENSANKMLHMYPLLTFWHTDVHTHLFRGTGQCNAHHWLPGQYLQQRGWFDHLWGGRVDSHQPAELHPQFQGGIWSRQGFWRCSDFLLLMDFYVNTKEKGRIIDLHQTGLYNKQNILEKEHRIASPLLPLLK